MGKVFTKFTVVVVLCSVCFEILRKDCVQWMTNK